MKLRRGAWTAAAAGIAVCAVLVPAWYLRDDLHALVSRDYAARRVVIRIIETRRTPEHRAAFVITLPESAPAPPESFEVHLSGRYLDMGLRVIDLECRGGRVTGRMASKEGIREGDIPYQLIDAFIRQSQYLKGVTQKRNADILESTGLTWVSHIAEFKVVMEAIPPQAAFTHFSSGQATAETIGEETELKRFTHTWICTELLRIARDQLQPVDDACRREAIVLGHLQSSTTTTPGGDDRSSILTDIYAHLAADWAMKNALPALERLGQDLDARRLEITAASDPGPLLKERILSADSNLPEGWMLSTWCLDYMAESVVAERRKEVLLRCLPRVRTVQLKAFILDDLAPFAADDAVAEAIRTVLRSESDEPEARIRAAVALQGDRADDEAFAFLIARALSPGEKAPQLSDVQRSAVRAVLASAEKAPGRRAEAATMLRELLQRLPPAPNSSVNGLDLLTEGLALLGLPEDEPAVDGYLRQGDNPPVDDIVIAMSTKRPRLAIEAARESLRSYVAARGEKRYWPYVHPFLWLFCALEARQAVAEIEAARDLLRETETPRNCGDELMTIETCLQSIGSSDAAERRRATIEFMNSERPRRDALYRAVVDRLRAAGADPRDLARLLEEPPRAKRSAVCE